MNKPIEKDRTGKKLCQRCSSYKELDLFNKQLKNGEIKQQTRCESCRNKEKEYYEKRSNKCKIENPIEIINDEEIYNEN